MRITRVICLLLFISEKIWSSTFVGNGGNVGDVEFQVALRQISDITLKLIEDNNNGVLGDALCSCPNELQTHPICEPLLNLNLSQKNFCSQFLRQKLGNLNQILAQKNQLEIRWTQDNIQVMDSSYLRAVDAVINWQNLRITINQNRFVQLKQSERVFLITHELLHLIESQDGQKLQDSGSIGPFDGSAGGRAFINAMAASLTVQSIDNGVLNAYFVTLNRSRAVESLWVTAGLGGLNSNANKSSSFAHRYFRQVQLGLRYQFTPRWGLDWTQHQIITAKSKVSGIMSNENLRRNQLHLVYRFFPSDNILSDMGQSHFNLGIGVDHLKGDLNLSDTYVGLQDSVSSLGTSLSLNYYFPHQGGLWGYVGGSLIHNPYRYQYDFSQYGLPQLEVNYPNTQTLFQIGVSYGF
jgi:hypothetical protein